MIAGIDIGSRSIAMVLMDGGTAVHQDRLPATYEPLTQAHRLLKGHCPDRIVATGCRAHLLTDSEPGSEVMTIDEIAASALGVHCRYPDARTILDMGGQGTRAIALNPRGSVDRVAVQDGCAAGTGRFLEHAATVFQIPVARFGDYAMVGDEVIPITSGCALFAEAEVGALLAQGHIPQNIALGLHAALVRRAVDVLARVGLTHPVVLLGGAARNRCMARLFAEILAEPVIVPKDPDLLGALGAAIHGGGKSLNTVCH